MTNVGGATNTRRVHCSGGNGTLTSPVLAAPPIPRRHNQEHDEQLHQIWI